MTELSLIERIELAAEDGEHYEVHLTEVGQVLRALKIVERMERRRDELQDTRSRMTSDWSLIIGKHGMTSNEAYQIAGQIRKVSVPISDLNMWLGTK